MSTSSAIPISSSIFIILTKSYTILCKDNFPSPGAKLPFLPGYNFWSPRLVKLTWNAAGQMYYIPPALVEKILEENFSVQMQIYVILGHLAWNCSASIAWCFVLFFFILAVTSVSNIGIAEMHPIIFLGISV